MNKSKIEYKLTLSANLKDLIKHKGVTITFVARNTGVPLQTIHGWLQGTHPKNLIQVKMIAEYFDMGIDDLCFTQHQALKGNSVLLENQTSRKFKIILIEE